MIKIAVSGIGGVGGYYGGLLAREFDHSKTVQVYFISRGENLKKIKTEGLKLKTQFQGDFTVRPFMATDNAAEIGEVDYLICATKSYDLEENIRQLKPCIGANTNIIPLLNGADITDRIQSVVPEASVWYGCTYIISRIPEPGLIVETTNPKEMLQFGSPTASKEKQKLLLNIFHKAGINAVNPENIIEYIWRKYSFISTAALCTSYYNSNYGDVRENHLEVFSGMVGEILQAAQCNGITLPQSLVDDTVATIRRYPGEATTSMHVDFMNHRQVEIETLGGYTLSLAKKHGITLPLHEKIINELRKRAAKN